MPPPRVPEVADDRVEERGQVVPQLRQLPCVHARNLPKGKATARSRNGVMIVGAQLPDLKGVLAISVDELDARGELPPLGQGGRLVLHGQVDEQVVVLVVGFPFQNLEVGHPGGVTTSGPVPVSVRVDGAGPSVLDRDDPRGHPVAPRNASVDTFNPSASRTTSCQERCGLVPVS